jgi:hypothetical protein
MNPPSASGSPQPQPEKPKVVVPGVSRRDIVIGILIAVAILSFVLLAIFYSGSPPRNLITGVIKSHGSSGERETLLTVSRKGVSEKTADTGYWVKVWVESEKREYDVMIEKDVWLKKKDGDTIQFLRPPSEQR